jgi:hypothetical protein
MFGHFNASVLIIYVALVTLWTFLVLDFPRSRRKANIEW